jgi:single-strand DNA-binding protein
MIKLQFIGNLGADAVRKEINGNTVLSFRAAHNYRHRSAEGVLTEQTTWIDCSYWGDRDAVLPFMTKGRQVFVEGIPSLDIYVTHGGEHKPALKLRVFSLQVLAEPRHEVAELEDGKPIDDLPF